MTNQEINLRMAEIEGLDVFKEHVWVYLSGASELTPIDYINDWNLLGPLVLKLINEGWRPIYDCNMYAWRYRDTITDPQQDFGVATCLAYIKEFG